MMSSAELSGEGAKGRFLKTMHIYKDQLCEFGGARKPNAGFLSTVIKPLETETAKSSSNTQNGGASSSSKRESEAKAKANDSFERKFKALSMDDRLIYGFLSTLLGVSTSCLPVVVSDIYQGMKASTQSKLFAQIDVKQSSFGKLGRFGLSKQLEGLVECKQQKSKVMIEGFD